MQVRLTPAVLLHVPAAQGAHVTPSGAHWPAAHDADAWQSDELTSVPP
jgi:hypothetical protein